MSSDRSLLIVEDDADLLETYARWFSRRGYDVTTFTHPRDALESVRTRPCRAAVVDLRLPEISGVELTRQLKEEAEIEVIVLSGQDDTTAKQQAINNGAFAYLLKPCPLSDLARTIEQALTSNGN